MRVRFLLKSEIRVVYDNFGKYKSDFSIITAVAIILDLRFKLRFVQWKFMKMVLNMRNKWLR